MSRKSAPASSAPMRRFPDYAKACLPACRSTYRRGRFPTPIVIHEVGCPNA